MGSVAEKDFTSLQLNFPAFSFIVPRFLSLPNKSNRSNDFNFSVILVGKIMYVLI